MSIFLKKFESGLLVLFLFTLPWQTRWIISPGLINNEYWEYGTLSLYASDILLIVIILLNLINFRLNKIKLKLSKSDLVIFISGLFVLIINTCLSLNQYLSLFHTAWLMLGLSLFIILRQELISRRTALLSLISGGAVVGLLGAAQFISQKTFAFSWLGLAQHSAGDLGTSVVEAVAPDGVIERWLRAYGSLDHPNMLAGFMALTIFFSLYLIFKQNTKDKKEIIIITSFIFLVAGLITSFSRSGLLAASLGLIIYFIFALKNGFKLMIKQTLPLFIIGLIIITLFYLPYYYIFLPRFSTTSRLEKLSTTERLAGYKESLAIIKQTPIIGSGFGTYGLALKNKEPDQLVWFYQPMHNVFLLIMAEMGMLGLILGLWFIIKKIIESWKKFPEERSIIIGTMVILLSLGLFDHWLTSLHFGILVSATALGLSLKKA